MPPDWLRLKARIEQFVTLSREPLELGGQPIPWFRVIDGDRLLTTAVQCQRASEELDPFWAATWRAAVGLDRYFSRLSLNGVRVLELGCGSGQAGVGAALRGAQVTLTDAVGLALLVARLNAWPVRERVQVQRLKWDAVALNAPRFPWIIGSDLVYDPSLFSMLERRARSHLVDGGRLLLSEPQRHTGDLFAEWIERAGWQTTVHVVDLADGRVPIRIFECGLKRER